MRSPSFWTAVSVWNNELSYMTSDEISERLMKLWGVMDACIRDGVSSSTSLTSLLRLVGPG